MLLPSLCDRFGDTVGGVDNTEDSLFGDGGNDELRGGVGSDDLDGGDDNDTLMGVDPSAQVDYGRSTIDTLTGGNGSDTFVLAENEVFYNSGIPDNVGIEDYALITDYEIDEDTLELNGSLEDYSFGASPEDVPSGLGIFSEQEESGNELIAVLQDVSNSDDVKTTIDFI